VLGDLLGEYAQLHQDERFEESLELVTDVFVLRTTLFGWRKCYGRHSYILSEKCMKKGSDVREIRRSFPEARQVVVGRMFRGTAGAPQSGSHASGYAFRSATVLRMA